MKSINRLRKKLTTWEKLGKDYQPIGKRLGKDWESIRKTVLTDWKKWKS